MATVDASPGVRTVLKNVRPHTPTPPFCCPMVPVWPSVSVRRALRALNAWPWQRKAGSFPHLLVLSFRPRRALNPTDPYPTSIPVVTYIRDK